jgi:hypothetical protein
MFDDVQEASGKIIKGSVPSIEKFFRAKLPP